LGIHTRLNVRGPVSEATASRLPDFIIIGAAKSGTTSVFRWLSEQPEVHGCRLKEPDYFSHDRAWRRGQGWYASLFAGAALGSLLGEASTSYTELRYAARTAARMAESVPAVKLLYLLRHPIDRLRSHYLHDALKARERRSLRDAATDSTNEYLGSSLYYTCLKPFTLLFPREQICVVRFEDVVSDAATGWSQILAHLGLSIRPRPTSVWNKSSDKPAYTRTMLKLWESGLLRPAGYLPSSVRRRGKAILTRGESDHARHMERSREALPRSVEDRIWADIHRLEMWLGSDQPLWERINGSPG
jgi:Sulfotransferase family